MFIFYRNNAMLMMRCLLHGGPDQYWNQLIFLNRIDNNSATDLKPRRAKCTFFLFLMFFFSFFSFKYIVNEWKGQLEGISETRDGCNSEGWLLIRFHKFGGAQIDEITINSIATKEISLEDIFIFTILILHSTLLYNTYKSHA